MTIWWRCRGSSPTAAPASLAQGAEFLRAKAAGRVDDDHIVGEIGEVLAGRIPGRERRPQITAYKSLGHVVQDLAAAAEVRRRLDPAACG
jgi:ornithine cyclodeaminase/alanine dehydrogenase-like protein (mu-crystallin family)